MDSAPESSMQNMDPLQPQSKDHEPAKQELLVEQGRDDEEHQRWIRNLFFKMDCRLEPMIFIINFFQGHQRVLLLGSCRPYPVSSSVLFSIGPM